MGDDLRYITTHMSQRITNFSIKIDLDRLNEAYFSRHPAPEGKIIMIHYTGKGYRLCLMRERTPHTDFPKSGTPIMSKREISALITGILAGLDL